MRDFPSLKQFYEAEPKILIRRVINRQDRLDAAYFERQMVFKKDLNPFIPIDPTCHPLFLLGLLNSRLLSYLYINTSTIATKDDFRQTTLAELRRLPVVVIKSSDPADKARQDEMVVKVEAILEAKELFSKAKIDKDKTYYENKCAALDRQIDRLVYDLYSLTPEEIAVVEGASAKRA
jgi:DNA-binding protein H-NS